MSDRYKAAQLQSQLVFLATSDTFSDAARAGGALYFGVPRAFVLPADHALENLYPPSRVPVREYFQAHGIAWHTANAHLLSSQVSCLNFLEPFADQPSALQRMIEPLLGPIAAMLEPEPDTAPGRFVAYEFIGGDYLNESGPKGRQRGTKCTSVDAAVRFRRPDGSIEMALIEWKYTEAAEAPKDDGRDGTRRWRYGKVAVHPKGPLVEGCAVPLEAFFREPVYQLFRHQMLAVQMERARELDCDRVTTMLVAPAGNSAVNVLKIDAIRPYGQDVKTALRALLQHPERFRDCTTDTLFAHARAATEGLPAFAPWLRYMGERYGLR